MKGTSCFDYTLTDPEGRTHVHKAGLELHVKEVLMLPALEWAAGALQSIPAFEKSLNSYLHGMVSLSSPE